MSTVRLYRPGSGTEGACFFEEWCTHCARDKAMSEGKPLDECDDNQVCKIIADTFAYEVTDSKYPREWTFDKRGRPCCTAFIPVGEPIPPPKDELTLDLFGE